MRKLVLGFVYILLIIVSFLAGTYIGPLVKERDLTTEELLNYKDRLGAFTAGTYNITMVEKPFPKDFDGDGKTNDDYWWTCRDVALLIAYVKYYGLSTIYWQLVSGSSPYLIFWVYHRTLDEYFRSDVRA